MNQYEIDSAKKLDVVLGLIIKLGKGGIEFDTILPRVKPAIIDGDELKGILIQLQKDDILSQETRMVNVATNRNDPGRKVEKTYYSLTPAGKNFFRISSYLKKLMHENDRGATMTELEKSQIVKAIKAEVKIAGSARVGYHAEQILGQNPIPHNIKSKLEGTITRSTKYVSVVHPNFPDDYEIKVKARSWAERNPYLHAIVIALIGAAISQAITLTVEKSKSQERLQLEHQQDLRLANLSDSLANLQTQIKNSVRKVKSP